MLLLAAAANATDKVSSIVMLLCFIAGLVTANTLVAALSMLGFRAVLENRIVMTGFATLTAVFSLTIGTLLLVGNATALPSLFGG